jgi:hypothetical protein
LLPFRFSDQNLCAFLINHVCNFDSTLVYTERCLVNLILMYVGSVQLLHYMKLKSKFNISQKQPILQKTGTFHKDLKLLFEKF